MKYDNALSGYNFSKPFAAIAVCIVGCRTNTNVQEQQ